MTLDAFLRERKLTNDAFAATVGVDGTMILRVRKGRANPSFALLKRIHEVTEGAVTPNDFLPELIGWKPEPETGAAA